MFWYVSKEGRVSPAFRSAGSIFFCQGAIIVSSTGCIYGVNHSDNYPISFQSVQCFSRHLHGVPQYMIEYSLIAYIFIDGQNSCC